MQALRGRIHAGMCDKVACRLVRMDKHHWNDVHADLLICAFESGSQPMLDLILNWLTPVTHQLVLDAISKVFDRLSDIHATWYHRAQERAAVCKLICDLPLTMRSRELCDKFRVSPAREVVMYNDVYKAYQNLW